MYTLDLELVLVRERSKVVLGILEMVLDSSTRVVYPLGWLGLGVRSGLDRGEQPTPP